MRRLYLALALAAAALLLPNRYGVTTFHEANTAGRVYAVQSLVHYGEWNLAPVLCRSGPRHSLVDLSVREGLPYLQKAPGVSWLGVPVYAGLSALAGGDKLPFHWSATVLGLLCVALPVLLVALLFGRYLSRTLGPRSATAGVLAWLVASPQLVYAGMFQDYPLAAALLLAGYLLLRGDRKAAWFAGAFLLGAAGTVSYVYWLYGALVGALAWLQHSREGGRALPALIAALAGAALPAAALLVYNSVVWGGPFQMSYDFIANADQRAAHAEVRFAWETLVAAFVDPKRGLFLHAPWTLVGFIGLGLMLRRPDSRWQGATALTVVAAHLAFIAGWETNKQDSLAFARHALGLYPWLAWGLAHVMSRLLDETRPPFLVARAAVFAAVAVGAVYAGVTAWTLPYHSDALVSPFWQINVPLLVNGAHLPPVPFNLFDPLFSPGLERLGGYWGWLGLGLGLVAAALAVGTLTRGQDSTRPLPRVAATLTGFIVAAALLTFGHLTNPVTPALADWAARTPPAQVRAAGPELYDLWLAARRDRRLYEAALSDLQGSLFTPQDVLWREEGHPETNEWCRAAGLR